MLKVKGIDHINMRVSNLNRSIEFYQKVFGFKIHEQAEYSGTPYAIIGKSHAMMLALYERGDLSSDQRINHIGINIENFQEACDFLHENEVEIVNYSGHEVIEYPESQSLYIKDPDGNEIELSSNFAGGL